MSHDIYSSQATIMVHFLSLPIRVYIKLFIDVGILTCNYFYCTWGKRKAKELFLKDRNVPMMWNNRGKF